MNEQNILQQDAKEAFRKCGTCSQTFAFLLNQAYENPKKHEEIAADPLAGGIVNQGHQCGMLWGATLGVGNEAFRRHQYQDDAVAIAVTASQHIVQSFIDRTNTVNCKEIIGCDLSSVFGLVKFMVKTMVKGMNNSQCFNLAEDWAPEAIEAGSVGLEDTKIQLDHPPMSCSAEVVRKLGGTEEEMVMASGFAGGLGLSGNACGAVAAAIWFKTLKWTMEHPGTNPPMFNNPMAKKILKAFREETNGEMLCSEITGKQFENINDHSKFMHCGGCEQLINVLVEN